MNKRQNTMIYPGSPYVDSTQINIRLHPALTITQSTNYHSYTRESMYFLTPSKIIQTLEQKHFTTTYHTLAKPPRIIYLMINQEDSRTATVDWNKMMNKMCSLKNSSKDLKVSLKFSQYCSQCDYDNCSEFLCVKS